jgi:hypothetical protein
LEINTTSFFNFVFKTDTILGSIGFFYLPTSGLNQEFKKTGYLCTTSTQTNFMSSDTSKRYAQRGVSASKPYPRS